LSRSASYRKVMASKPRTEPLPCPFCGGEAEFACHNVWLKENRPGYHYLRCTGCKIRGPSKHGILGRERALEQWNRRDPWKGP
jgi:Lar family restriction alleviation protein